MEKQYRFGKILMSVKQPESVRVEIVTLHDGKQPPLYNGQEHRASVQRHMVHGSSHVVANLQIPIHALLDQSTDSLHGTDKLCRISSRSESQRSFATNLLPRQFWQSIAPL